jgi:hypothetical protein
MRQHRDADSASEIVRAWPEVLGHSSFVMTELIVVAFSTVLKSESRIVSQWHDVKRVPVSPPALEIQLFTE